MKGYLAGGRYHTEVSLRPEAQTFQIYAGANMDEVTRLIQMFEAASPGQISLW